MTTRRQGHGNGPAAYHNLSGGNREGSAHERSDRGTRNRYPAITKRQHGKHLDFRHNGNDEIRPPLQEIGRMEAAGSEPFQGWERIG